MDSSPNLRRLLSAAAPYLLLIGLLLLILIPASQSKAQMAPPGADGPAMTSAPQILVLADDPLHSPSYVVRALEREGLPYTLVDDDVAKFEEAFGSQEWDLVIMANDYLKPTETIFDVLNDYVRKGGRLIIHTWAMADFREAPLWETLGVRHVETAVVPYRDKALPIYWWEKEHPVFNVPNDKVPMFLEMSNTFEKEPEWPVEHVVEAARGFLALGGYKEGSDPAASGLVANPLGVTVFRGFVDFINEADLNRNVIPDSVELWQNLIHYVLTADPRPGSFSKVAPTNNATDVTLDVLLDWGTSSNSSKYYYCYDTSDNDTCNSGWHSTSASSALVKDLAPNTPYFWHVRAENLYGTTYANSNTWWKFTTGTAPPSLNFLPLLMNVACSSFPSSSEIEPNDTAPSANGPLCFGFSITGNPNNNSGGPTAADFDWFSFSWSGNGTLHVDVTNFLFDAQVILRDSAYTDLEQVYWSPDGHYVIDYVGTGAPGTYYVLVFAPADHPTDSGDYTLTISN